MVTARKRGRPRKAKVEEPEDEDAITLDLDDIMNMPDTASPAKKRKPPVKSAAAKYVLVNVTIFYFLF